MKLSFTAAVAIFTALVSAGPRAATLTDTLTPTLGEIGSIAVNPVTNKVYLSGDLGVVGVIDGATHAVTTIAINSSGVIAVNPVTNKIYVAAFTGLVVQVIDGATNQAKSPVPVGTFPSGIAVNPVTNKIYVACSGNNWVMVIDGSTDTATSPIAVGTNPVAVAVNPVTGKVYVANTGNSGAPGSVTIIDGAAGTVLATVPVGPSPRAIAVNPVTNMVYVASSGSSVSGNVTAIDGATNAVTATIPTEIGSTAIVANPATNQIFVANQGFGSSTGSVTMIDGATNGTTTIGAGVLHNPRGLALNPVTNTVYVMQGAGNAGIGAIDGATGVLTLGPGPATSGGGNIAVNPVTNVLYEADAGIPGHVYVIDENDYATTTIAAPFAVPQVVNPVTGKVYTCSSGGGGQPVIDSATDTVTLASIPCVKAVNAATNRLYGPTGDGRGLSVIDGASDTVLTTIALGITVGNVVVDEATNRVYVTTADFGNIVKVVDGATNTLVSTVTVGTGATPIDMNRATNRVYVANILNGTVSVIDGATNTASTIVNGGRPQAGIAANPITDKIYVTNNTLGSVSVIDGATQALAVVPAGASPSTVVVNPAANKIYVTNLAPGGGITAIDGATNTVQGSVALAPGSNGPCGIALDSVRDKVYVANCNNATVTIIDGTTLATTTVHTATTNPTNIVVNPVNGKVYVSGANDSSGITVITPARAALTNHGVTLSGGSVTSSDAPALTFNVCCAYAPNDPPTLATYFRIGDTNGTFSAAPGSGATFTSPPARLQPGLNFVKAWTLDATGDGGDPFIGTSLIGAPAVFPLVSVAPVFTTSTLPGGVVGDSYSQTVTAVGSGPFLFTVTSGTLPPGLSMTIGGFIHGTLEVPGTFTFTVTASDGTGNVSASHFYAIAVLASSFPREIGISTRMGVLSGENVVIGGFAIGGSGAHKTVVIRARGPSLAASGVANPLANPVLQLFNGSTLIATNDDWQSAPNADLIRATGFAPPYAGESAILVTLDSGLYTAVVTGANGATGVGIVEVFEVDNSDVPLIAISTRGLVQTGDNVMIGGFVIGGDGPQTVVVRARGPSLGPQGVSNPLQDPTLTLVGTGVSVTNDNWGSAPNAAQIQASGFAPSDPRESAILMTLPPGAYTALVSGVGDTTGVAIVEVFAQ